MFLPVVGEQAFIFNSLKVFLVDATLILFAWYM